MQKTNFRAPAVPLITHDPFFSLWSCADTLTGDTTRHWDGVRKFMYGVLAVDDVLYDFLGKPQVGEYYHAGYGTLEQTGCRIRPLSTVYTFRNAAVELELQFTSPLLPDDLMLLSRPISYISYRITPLDGQPHQVSLHLVASAEFCVNSNDQEVFAGMTPFSLYFSSGTEQMLKRCGDSHRIEWGELHLISTDHTLRACSLHWFHRYLVGEYFRDLQYKNNIGAPSRINDQMGAGSYLPYTRHKVSPEFPVLWARKDFTLDGEPVEGFVALGYNDIKSLQYFEKNVEPYWRKDGDTFAGIMHKAIRERASVMARVREFEEALLEKANRISPEYADILSLAYRQVVAGHKLTCCDGELQFISKENYSNGCAATVDVTYPSIPMFLIWNPDLVEGMLNPIFRMIDLDMWPYEFAPHDAGTYPLVNGQIYGYAMGTRMQRDPIDSQMPVEECGNMILCVAALCFARKDMAYFGKHRAILKQWADYLVKVGHDPDNQLCTDDFAGHLAHNCNLSVKAICALGAFARLLEAVGSPEEAASYRAAAEDYAAKWERDALNGDHYRLAFDQPDTWSLKYNMVWDRLLKLGLFSPQVYSLETAWYKKQVKAYGIPLDCRSDYTKTDWAMWSTQLSCDPEYTAMVIHAMWEHLCATPNRAPFSDWTFASHPCMRGFQARTVQGGLFINLLQF